MKYSLLFLVLAGVICMIAAATYLRGDQDLDTAASGHGHYGRVQIKVYRGQSKGGHDHGHAPYGYWVRQPPDHHGHHH